MTSILLSPIPTPLINTRESETPVSTVPIMIVIQVNKQIIKLKGGSTKTSNKNTVGMAVWKLASYPGVLLKSRF